MELLRDDDLKRSRFSASIDYYQGNAAVREDCNYYLQIGWPLIRRSLQIIGERLVTQGVLDAPEQIHFLEKEELFSLVDGDSEDSDIRLGNLTDSRQKTWQNQRSLIAPLTLSGEEETQNGWDAETGIMQAIGASPGIARGIVRIVIDDHHARQFKKGEVLVIRAASPLFTPLMLMASALIVEVGGGASHSSLVARELGLPAVVNAENATSILKSGQEVEIDGEQGRITLIDTA
jgi:pyruvate,water dikinase